MTIGNGGSRHREERSWWAQGPGCADRIGEWECWIQQDHSSAIEKMLEGVTFKNGRISVKIDDAQPPFQISMQDGRGASDHTVESSPVKPLAHVNSARHEKENLETTIRKTYPSAGSEIWHGPPGAIKVMYDQVHKPLDWEALAVTTKEPEFDPNSLRVIMKQGAWSEQEKTIAWESYMQTEGLSQQVSCQHCDCRKKPIVVVTQGNAQPRRQLVCFCTSCWSFTDIHHRREARRTFPSSDNSTLTRASSLGHCRTQTSSIQGGSGGRSRTMRWITFEGIASSFERQEDQTRIPTSSTGHSRWKN